MLPHTGTVALLAHLKIQIQNITITKFVDEADGIAANNNDTTIPTSAAVKDYVDSNVTAQDLDITDGTNNGSVDLDSQSLTFTGDAGVSATVSGQTLTLDSSALQSQITSNDSDITALQAADATLQSNIDAEEAARIAADSALQTQITNNDTDITALQAADTTLQNNIDAEEAARIAADTTLQTNITAEASTRSSADTTLQTNIDTEEAARIAADTTLQTNITTEASTRASADTALQRSDYFE
jgi:trimeric autotransporter adhesin